MSRRRKLTKKEALTTLLTLICVLIAGLVAPFLQPEAPLPENSSFQVHFIDVGQADAALVICDGDTMLIDGGNVADSDVIYTYLKKHNITHLNYIVSTHPHEDHVGGLAGAVEYASVGVAYSPVTTFTTSAFNNFKNALYRRGVNLSVPSVGTRFDLGSASCQILAINTDTKDTNNTSIVLRIVYGETSFLFTGDAEKEVEDALIDSDFELKSTVLKVGHHGSYSSTSYVFLREVMPEYAVIPVGKDNDYGHPHDIVLSRLRDADVTLYRTDMHGDVICTSDGKAVSFQTAKNPTGNVFGKIGKNSIGAG